MSLGKYLKSAFLNQWNLLFFVGGLAFSFLTGRPDVVAPLVLAAEVAYLGLLGTHTKFQRYVDAQEAKAARARGTAGSEATLERILRSLPAKALERFETLRSRCLELRQIALQLKDPGRRAHSPTRLEELQLAGLDKLLWIYLRLLFTQHSLERFLAATSDDRILKEIERLETRLEKVSAKEETPQREKVRKALEDNLDTCRARLENLQKARDNYELVELEIDRLENKIRSLSELAINRQEPDFISGQVDQVASSLINTERTMSELQFATGLESADERVPELVRRQTLRATD